MATTTTTTNNLRYTFDLANGDTRYIDVENPIADTATIATNVTALSNKIQSGDYAGILVGQDFFDGDTDAYVTKINSAEIIKITKTTETTQIV